MEALHKRQGAWLLQQAKDRLEQAIVQAQDRAPMVSDLARQLLDALVRVGI
jgi:hypothetical protein